MRHPSLHHGGLRPRPPPCHSTSSGRLAYNDYNGDTSLACMPYPFTLSKAMVLLTNARARTPSKSPCNMCSRTLYPSIFTAFEALSHHVAPFGLVRHESRVPTTICRHAKPMSKPKPKSNNAVSSEHARTQSAAPRCKNCNKHIIRVPNACTLGSELARATGQSRQECTATVLAAERDWPALPSVHLLQREEG